MDDATYQKIQQYVQALKALQRSVERSLQEGTFEGTGRMAVKSYQGIQRKIAEIMPDDFYITDTLALDTAEAQQERHMLSQVQLAASQMIIYLDGLQREYRAAAGVVAGDFSDLKSLGRDLQEQILSMTKTTIRRALSNIDIDMDTGESSAPANMEGADLQGGNFNGRNLKYANFRGAVLRGGSFSGANLKGANFEDVDGDGANFSGSNLKDANFAGANLSNANLTGANLKGANLEGANLQGADISGANFNDANLQGVILPHGQEYRSEGDLAAYGASARQSSTGRARVRIAIERDDVDDDKPKNDDLQDDDLR